MSDKKIIELNAHEDEELEALYAQADKDMPPAELDRTIRQAARDQDKPGTADKYRWFAGIAASVLVAILFIQLYPQSLVQQPLDYSAEEKRTGRPDAVTDMMEPAATMKQAEESALPMKRQMLSSPTIEQSTQPAQAARAVAPESLKLENGRSKSAQFGQLSGTDSDTESEPDSASSKAATHKLETAKRMLSEIENFIEAGELDKARQMMDALKQHYPDFPIDPDIVKKLGQ